MPLTPNLATVTVSGTYVDIQGNAIAGQVKFTPRAILIDPAADQTIIPKTITVTLDVNGGFSVVLPVTDDPDLTPTGFTYRVEESFSGGRSYDITIPSSPVTLNLADVVPALPNDGSGTNYVLLSQYTSLNAQVQTMVTTVNSVTSITGIVNTAAASASTASSQATSSANSASTAATAATNAATAATNAATEATNQVANYIHPFLLMGV